LSYDINQKFQISVLGKFYYSLLQVNDTFVDPEKTQNFYWVAATAGFNISYKF
jgi:hypothetical protein